MSKTLKISVVLIAITVLFWLLLIYFENDDRYPLYILTILFGAATIVTKEVREVLGLDKEWDIDKALEWLQESRLSRSALNLFLVFIRSAIQYAEFIFLIVTVILVAAIFYDSLIIAIEDLAQKKQIQFHGQGFFHLQVYLFGFIIVPMAVVFPAVYGLKSGIRLEEKGFLKLFFYGLFGFLLAILIVSEFRGNESIEESKATVAAVHGAALPMGSKPLELMVQFGSALIFAFCIASYTFFWFVIGRIFNGILRKLRKQELE